MANEEKNISPIANEDGSVTLTVSAEAVKQYAKLRDWKFKTLPAKFRVSDAEFVSQMCNFDNAKAAAKYAENQQLAAILKLVDTVAAQRNLTRIDAAKAMGIQLPDQK